MTLTYKRKLRNYLINKDLQLRLIRNNVFYLLLCVIATVSILLYPLIHEMMFSPDLESQYRAAQTFLLLVKWLVPAIIMMTFQSTASRTSPTGRMPLTT